MEELLKNYEVSYGTLNILEVCENIRTFIDGLFYDYDLDNTIHYDIILSLDKIKDDIDSCDEDTIEEAYFIYHEELFDKLNCLAPEGYYYGTHPGDGACFGFWQREKL